MIRKNPSDPLSVITESAYVDQTAIICGKVIIDLVPGYKTLQNEF